MRAGLGAQAVCLAWLAFASVAMAGSGQVPSAPGGAALAPSRPAADKLAPAQSQPAARRAEQKPQAQKPEVPKQAAARQAASKQAAPSQSASTPAASKPVSANPAPVKPAPLKPAPARPDRSTAPLAAAPSEPKWIGLLVPPYPPGYKSNTGGCVGSGRSAEQICARSIGTIDDAEDRSVKLYAAELVGRIGNEARWRITDVAPYPRLLRGERVSISTCVIDGAADAGVIAVVDTWVEDAGSREMFDASRWAVRLDRRTGRFVDVRPAEVRCYNEGVDGE